MYHLIKKDFFMQKRQLMIAVLLTVFFSFTLSNMGTSGFIIGILAITYQLVFGASALEDKNNSDIILNSLPIKKNTIVLSKYVSIYVFTAYAIILYGFISIIDNVLKLPLNVPFTFTGLMGALAVVTLHCSISFPLLFKYGYIKSKIANLFVFFVFVFGGTAMVKYWSQGNQAMMEQNPIALFSGNSNVEAIIVSLIPLLIILISSYFMSLAFYTKREF